MRPHILYNKTRGITDPAVYSYDPRFAPKNQVGMLFIVIEAMSTNGFMAVVEPTSFSINSSRKFTAKSPILHSIIVFRMP
jgi:hypothetical protein